MIEAHARQFERRLTSVIEQRLKTEIVIGLQGARSVGKSTLLRGIATTRGVEVIDLDDPVIRSIVESNIQAFMSGSSPVCIDEYQHVPEVLDAIKAELNKEQRPGRYVITGSTRYDALPRAAQSLTGRLHMLTVRPLSQGEIGGVHETFVEKSLSEPACLVNSQKSKTARIDYVARIVAGGFPMALQRTVGADRNRWFADYVQQTLERDLLGLSMVRQRAKLPQLLEQLAGQTGQLLNIRKAAESIDLEPRTAENYSKLLAAVFLIQLLPAWGQTLRSRAGAKPKLHLVDSGVAAWLMRLTPQRLSLLEPAALAEFGHLLETFVVGEILKQVSWFDDVVNVGHWRTHDGDEIDIVLERADGRVVAMEVKAGSRTISGDLRSLRKFRDALGDRFLGGFLMNTGERSYSPEDRLHVMPIDRLWG